MSINCLDCIGSEYAVVRKNTFIEVVAAEDSFSPLARGRSPGRAMTEPATSRETTPTRKPGALEDRSTDTGSSIRGSPLATPTMHTRNLNAQPWQPQFFWQYMGQNGGMEENNWNNGSSPAGSYDGPMYDNGGMHQWMEPNGYGMNGGYYNEENQWIMSDMHDEWGHYDEKGEWDRRHNARMTPHDKARRMKRMKAQNSGSKVFVGGLCSKTTDESLMKAFQHFGNVISASVLVDSQSRRSRGFGYVTFAGEVPDGVSDRDHLVDGRMCGARLYKYN
jgi:hypothetical protein